MATTYSIAITGLRAGIARENATQQLVDLLKVTDIKVISILESQKFVVKSGVDLATAAKYEAALRSCGCNSVVEPEVEEAEQLKFDVSGMGLQDETASKAESLGSALVSCDACGKNISMFAEMCPSCGAPNSWTHPEIKRVIELKDKTGVAEKFSFNWNKTEIWGETQKYVPWQVRLIALIVFLVIYLPLGILGSLGFFFGPINIFLALGIFVLLNYVLGKIYGRNKTFHANLRAKTWTSSDDSFWQPVRTILKV